MDRPHAQPSTPPASGPRRSPGILAKVFGTAERDPRLDWTRRPLARRLLVVAQVTVLVLSGSMWLTGREGLALLAFLAFFPLMSFINVGVHGISELPARDLDEILVQVRDRATRRAHFALTVVFGVIALVTPMVASAVLEVVAAQDTETTVRQLTLATLGVFFLTMLLPAWVLAWTLPSDEAP